jgi:hypothetical protein
VYQIKVGFGSDQSSLCVHHQIRNEIWIESEQIVNQLGAAIRSDCFSFDFGGNVIGFSESDQIAVLRIGFNVRQELFRIGFSFVNRNTNDPDKK